MGFINLGRLNIRKRNACASAHVSLSDVQPPSVYKSHILNGPINKLYIFIELFYVICLLETTNIGSAYVQYIDTYIYKVKPVLVATPIKQAACFKQAGILFPKQANILKCTCVKQALVLSSF